MARTLLLLLLIPLQFGQTSVGELRLTLGALTSHDRFPISQDQRHTLRGRVTHDISHRAWAGAAISYGSGLPVEFEGDENTALQQFGRRIVDRVDFARGPLTRAFRVLGPRRISPLERSRPSPTLRR